MAIHTTDTIQNFFTSYKLVIKFSELTDTSGTSLGLDDYVVYMLDGFVDNTRFIGDIKTDLSIGNDDVAVLGVAESSTAMVQVYDYDGTLNPDNSDSVYNGYLLNGIRAELYKATEVNSSETPGTDAYYQWQAYGEWYTTGFNAELSDGSYAPVQLSFEDRMNNLGAKSLDFTAEQSFGFSGLSGAELLARIFEFAGLSENDYVIHIDPNKDNFSGWGVKPGDLVRDIINRVCQATLTRCYFRMDGKLYVEEIDYITGRDIWQVDGMNALTSNIGQNVIYNDACVKYYIPSDFKFDELCNEEVDLVTGDNNISLFFNGSAMSIDDIRAFVSVENANEDSNNTGYAGDGEFNITEWSGWEKGVNIKVYSTANIPKVTLVIYGHVVDGEPRRSAKQLVNEDVATWSSMTFEFDSLGTMSSSAANTLAANIASAIRKLTVKKAMHDTAYSIDMQIGDVLQIQNCGTSFDGYYKISRLSMETGETYSLSLEFMPVSVD